MKLLALTPWPIIPAMAGGSERCFNLLSRVGEITVFALDWHGTQDVTQRVRSMTHRTIPANPEAVARARKLLAAGITNLDVMPTLVADDLTTFREAIEEFDPDLIILEHPWMVDLIGERPYILDCHNFESSNTALQLGRHSLDYSLVAGIERRAVQGAEHITYCSEDDVRGMAKAFPFGTPNTLIPNGCDIPKRLTAGQALNELRLSFIGSNYKPNIQAAKNLITLAPLLADYTIQIAGGVCDSLQDVPDVQNVQILGKLTDTGSDNFFSHSHQFVNLIEHGSGTHLKIARALSYGVPVVTTPIGARGYKNLNVTSLANVPDMVRAVTEDWERHHLAAVEQSKLITWDVIGTKFREVINGLQ